MVRDRLEPCWCTTSPEKEPSRAVLSGWRRAFQLKRFFKTVGWSQSASWMVSTTKSQELRQSAEPDIVIMLVGNKAGHLILWSDVLWRLILCPAKVDLVEKDPSMRQAVLLCATKEFCEDSKNNLNV